MTQPETWYCLRLGTKPTIFAQHPTICTLAQNPILLQNVLYSSLLWYYQTAPSDNILWNNARKSCKIKMHNSFYVPNAWADNWDIAVHRLEPAHHKYNLLPQKADKALHCPSHEGNGVWTDMAPLSCNSVLDTVNGQLHTPVTSCTSSNIANTGQENINLPVSSPFLSWYL